LKLDQVLSASELLAIVVCVVEVLWRRKGKRRKFEVRRGLCSFSQRGTCGLEQCDRTGNATEQVMRDKDKRGVASIVLFKPQGLPGVYKIDVL
jgi:hypothetical protein